MGNKQCGCGETFRLGSGGSGNAEWYFEDVVDTKVQTPALCFPPRHPPSHLNTRRPPPKVPPTRSPPSFFTATGTMVSPMYDLTPFPTPPSPPRQGLVGWLQRRISKKNLHASEIPLPPRPSPPVLPQPSTEPPPSDETHHEHPPTKYHRQHHHSAVIEISRRNFHPRFRSTPSF